jgi:hypothetical protein
MRLGSRLLELLVAAGQFVCSQLIMLISEQLFEVGSGRQRCCWFQYTA